MPSPFDLAARNPYLVMAVLIEIKHTPNLATASLNVRVSGYREIHYSSEKESSHRMRELSTAEDEM